MRTLPSDICFLLLIAAVTVPYRFNLSVGPFSTISILEMIVLVGTIYLCARFLILTPIYLGPRIVFAAVLVPVMVSVASIGWASNPALSASTAIKYAYTALCYFVPLQLARGWPRTTLIGILVVVLLGWLAGSMAMYLAIPGFYFFVADSARMSQNYALDLIASMYTRLGHPYLGQSNDYAPLLAFIAFILLGYARLFRSVPVSIFSFVAFAACVLTFSRGVILGLLAGLLVYVMCIRVSIAKLLLLGVATTIVVILAWVLAKDTYIELADRDYEMHSLIEGRLDPESVEARLDLYREAAGLLAERPLLGHGAGFHDPSSDLDRVSAHNAYLEQWKYFGVILGTVTSFCYLVPLIYFFGLRVRERRTADWSDAIACGWLALAVSSSVETFFEASVPRAIIYLLLGLSVAMTGQLVRPPFRKAQGAVTPFIRGLNMDSRSSARI